MTKDFQLTTLANNLTVITEHMPGVRSATIGIWVKRGSRHEPAPLNGICHFIEHAVFKGTRRRTALDIAIESDRLGGHLDAYTTHELTAFSMKVCDTGVEQAFDLLADMLAHPRFDAEDLEREQRVILEEMKMVEDTPEEHLAELFNTAYFPKHPLGRPIEGTAKTVPTFDADHTRRFHQHAYAPANLVIAAAGNITHEQILELAARSFGDSTSETDTAAPHLEANEAAIETAPAPAAPILIRRKKDLEQAHLILAAPWVSARDEDRYAASLLASVIGGGTSSRLWQRVREERGLAYSVGASGGTYTDTGVFQIYAATSPDTLDEVLDISLQELRRTTREAVGNEELRLVKDQAISSILLSLESSSARAGTLARQHIVHNRRVTPDEIIARYEQVTPDDVQRVARTYFKTDTLALGALGNLNGFKVDRSRLEI